MNGLYWPGSCRHKINTVQYLLLPHSPYDDRTLLTLIAEGDEAAFKQLYDQYLPTLLPFLRKLTGVPHLADEVLQETFIRLWMSRDKLVNVQHPRAWIFEVASHAAYTWLRKHIRYQQALGKLASNQSTSDMQEPIEEYLHLGEAKRLIQQAVDQLPDQRRRIYRLSREEGMTISDIAAALNISPNTVKNTLVTALAFIRDHLQKAGYQLPLFLLIMLS